MSRYLCPVCSLNLDDDLACQDHGEYVWQSVPEGVELLNPATGESRTILPSGAYYTTPNPAIEPPTFKCVSEGFRPVSDGQERRAIDIIDRWCNE